MVSIARSQESWKQIPLPLDLPTAVGSWDNSPATDRDDPNVLGQVHREIANQLAWQMGEVAANRTKRNQMARLICRHLVESVRRT